jgi:hypothetical protein
MKSVSLSILVLFCCANLFGTGPEPYLKSAPMPFYPVIARTARIEGTVSLQAIVNVNRATHRTLWRFLGIRC